jgi:hypothetical protein
MRILPTCSRPPINHLHLSLSGAGIPSVLGAGGGAERWARLLVANQALCRIRLVHRSKCRRLANLRSLPYS